jgi:plastocyanin
MRTTAVLCLVGFTSLFLACNSGADGPGPADSGTGTNGPTITIQGYAFSPLELTVDAGTTIRVVNLDSMAHTVTSEASDNAFVAGAVAGVSFDTGQVNPGSDPGGGYGYVRGATGSASITIPASAPSGTVVPYFCVNHAGTMVTPNGHITVR